MPSRTSDGKIVFKLVFYGPSMGGKTTALRWIFDKEGLTSGKMQSITDPTGRTLFFDRVVAGVGGAMFQCYTTAGQHRHKIQRQTVLNGVDGLLFTWDSASDQTEENIWSLKELVHNLGEKLRNIPFNILANKRDLQDAIPIQKIRELIHEIVGPKELDPVIYETVALNGTNIKRAFVTTAREAVIKYFEIIRQKRQAMAGAKAA